MILYLIQHGEAKSKADDPQRGLSGIGIVNTEKAAAFMKSKEIEISLILHSGKTRARQTAQIIADALDKKQPVEVYEHMAPMDDVSLVKKALDGLTAKTVLLVGHLPHLSGLASLLLTADPGNPVSGSTLNPVIAFCNAGIVCLSNECGGWQLEWMVVPSIL